jgi:ATP adenylyltransferase
VTEDYKQVGDGSAIDTTEPPLAVPEGDPPSSANTPRETGKAMDRMRLVANFRLWAPWRVEYVKGGGSDDCIFCSKPALGDDAEALIPFRAERCFVMLNAYPYTNGHVMIAPYEHTADLAGLDDDTATELMGLTKRSLRAIDHAYDPDGYNVGANLGRIAGAGIADHVHLHVVPRWTGDTNFMPVVGDTRVMPQSLEDSFAALRDAFAALDG